MMLRLFLFLIAWNFQPLVSFANVPYSYTYYKEVITVIGEKEGYVSNVTYRGIMSPGVSPRINISYSELEEVSNVQVQYTSAKGKRQKLKKKEIGNDMLLTGTFYSGYRSHFFHLPEQPVPYAFQYSYTNSSNTLMLFSKLFLNSGIPTDTIVYEVRVPKELYLQYEIQQGATSSVVVTEEISGDYRVYTFSSYPAAPVTAQTQEYYLHPRPDIAYVDVIVLPQGVTDGFEYFNQWYLKLVEPREYLNDHTKQLISSITKEAHTDEEKIRLVYDYVRDKITYIDIENGIGAFQPRDPNDILLKKQGDCKDMANLICQSLRHLGMDARMAISSSLSHFTDLTFPNLSSANHAICVVRLEDKWIYLDATDPCVGFGFPSRHTQDRNIFIVHDSGGELHKIHHVPASENVVVNRFNLTKSGSRLSGAVEHRLFGISMAEIRSVTTTKSEQVYRPLIRKYLSSQSKNISYKEVSIQDDQDSMIVQSEVNSTNNFLSVDGRNYLSLNFLLLPHRFPQQVDSSYRLITYQAVNNHFEYTIQLDQPSTLVKAPEEDYSNGPFGFRFSVSQPKPDILKINYSYLLDAVVVSGEDIEKYNALNKLIQSTLSQSIVYENL